MDEVDFSAAWRIIQCVGSAGLSDERASLIGLADRPAGQ